MFKLLAGRQLSLVSVYSLAVLSHLGAPDQLSQHTPSLSSVLRHGVTSQMMHQDTRMDVLSSLHKG